MDLIIGQDVTNAVMSGEEMVVNHYIGLLNLTTAFNQTRLEHSRPVRLVHGYNRLDNLPILIKPIALS